MGDWQETAKMYSTLFQKPKMTEKLLSKPPFAFLHDVVMATIKATNFAADLYTPEEQDANNVKADKHSKVNFLQKMIDLVQSVGKVQLQVKSSKIVAGLEPELTNEWLQ